MTITTFYYRKHPPHRHLQRNRQAGFALLMLLIIVFGVGSLGVASMAGQAKGDQFRVSSLLSMADQRLLTDARQSLISYATLYHFMYGPRGAGPGHLPCPDTDSLVNARDVVLPVNRFSTGDSPDPPCGRLAVAHGHLPRHIRLPAQRYAFHAEPSQVATYQVAGQVINNPVNRIVNPSIAESAPGAAGVAARISVPGKQSGSRAASVVVSFDALLSGVHASVAAWIIGKVRLLTPAWCSGQSGHSVNKDDAGEVAIINALHCTHYQIGVEACPKDAIVLLLVDRMPELDRCAIDSIELLTIDGVPARHHWFVKNQWMGWFDISSAHECITVPVEVCELQLVRVPGAAAEPMSAGQPHAVKPVRLQWIPAP